MDVECMMHLKRLHIFSYQADAHKVNHLCEHNLNVVVYNTGYEAQVNHMINYGDTVQCGESMWPNET